MTQQNNPNIFPRVSDLDTEASLNTLARVYNTNRSNMTPRALVNATYFLLDVMPEGLTPLEITTLTTYDRREKIPAAFRGLLAMNLAVPRPVPPSSKRGPRPICVAATSRLVGIVHGYTQHYLDLVAEHVGIDSDEAVELAIRKMAGSYDQSSKGELAQVAERINEAREEGGKQSMHWLSMTQRALGGFAHDHSLQPFIDSMALVPIRDPRHKQAVA